MNNNNNIVMIKPCNYPVKVKFRIIQKHKQQQQQQQ